MKFKPEIPGAVLSQEVLEQDWAQAPDLGKIKLGEQCLFLKKFSGTVYLPYDRIVRVWLRQEEVKARLCCGTANFDQFYLVAVCGDGKEHRWHIPDKAIGQICLDSIFAKQPDVKIGFIKNGSL